MMIEIGENLKELIMMLIPFIFMVIALVLLFKD